MLRRRKKRAHDDVSLSARRTVPGRLLHICCNEKQEVNRRFLWFGPFATIAVGWIPHEILTDYNHLPFHWAAVSCICLAFAATVRIAVCEEEDRALLSPFLLAAPAVFYTFVNAIVFGSLISLLRPGPQPIHGWTLLGSAAIAWTINLTCFALWYWTIDFVLRQEQQTSELSFRKALG